MRYLLALLLTFCLSTCLHAQAPDTLWTRTYNWGPAIAGAYTVLETADGGFLIGGSCCGNLFHWFYYSLALMKADSTGEQEWRHEYWGYRGSTPGVNATAYDLRSTRDGGYICAAWMGQPVYFGPSILWKFNSAGDSVWTRAYQQVYEDAAYAVRQTVDLGYVAAGEPPHSVFKTDSAGNMQWWINSSAALRSVELTPDGGYIAAGATTSSPSDVYVVKASANGETQWFRMFGGAPYRDWAIAVFVAFDGGYLVAGNAEHALAGGSDMYLIRLSPSGETLWERTFGGSQNDEMAAAYQTVDGGLIAAGFSQSFAHDSSFYLVRFNDQGDTLWTKAFGSGFTCESVIQTADSGYVVTGSSWDQIKVIRLAKGPLAAEPGFIPHPSSFSLSAYPNPFNPVTTLEFTLPKSGRAGIVIYDITGREILKIADKPFIGGVHQTVTFDGAALPSGIYFAHLNSGDLHATIKLLLLK